VRARLSVSRAKCPARLPKPVSGAGSGLCKRRDMQPVMPPTASRRCGAKAAVYSSIPRYNRGESRIVGEDRDGVCAASSDAGAGAQGQPKADEHLSSDRARATVSSRERGSHHRRSPLSRYNASSRSCRNRTRRVASSAKRIAPRALLGKRKRRSRGRRLRPLLQIATSKARHRRGEGVSEDAAIEELAMQDELGCQLSCLSRQCR